MRVVGVAGQLVVFSVLWHVLGDRVGKGLLVRASHIDLRVGNLTKLSHAICVVGHGLYAIRSCLGHGCAIDTRELEAELPVCNGTARELLRGVERYLAGGVIRIGERYLRCIPVGLCH